MRYVSWIGPFTSRMLPAVFSGEAACFLDLDQRPKEYDDVGRLCSWDNLYTDNELKRSRYERVLINAILRRNLEINGADYEPVGMDGWDEVVFARETDGKRLSVHIDELKQHLTRWERSH